jgi:hypothetical protein
MISFILEGSIRSIQAATVWNIENTSEFYLEYNPLKLEKKQASDVVRHYTLYVPKRHMENLYCSENLLTDW